MRVGVHDLLLEDSTARLGHWTECECGWISAGYVTEGAALDAHQAHVERIAASPPLR